MRASELLLIVRAQNQASGALRRVAGDLRGLSAVSGLRQRGQALQIARQQMMLQRQIAQNELRSITTGKRAQEMAIARSRAEGVLANAVQRRDLVTQQQTAREAQVLRNRANISRLERAYQTAPSAKLAEEARLKLRAAGLDAERLASRQAFLAEKLGIASSAITTQNAKLTELSAREAEAARRADVLRQRIANYGDRLRLNTAQINDNNKAISRARWDKVAAGGRILQHTSRIMEYAGLVLGGTLAVLAHGAAQFETSVTLAATQTRSIGGSFQQTARHSESLQKSIRELMTQFPASADEMSKAAYDIYSSLNVNLPQGVKLLKVFNQAAVAGQTSLDEVAQAGITVMNDFRIRPAQMSKAFQTMFAAVRFGRMTFQQFVQMMPQLSPAFSAAGFGLREMAQAAAFMTRVMPNTRMAATSLARLTEMFGRKDFIAGAEKMGARITDLHHRLLPLPTIIDNLAKKFPNIAKAIKAGRGDTELQNFFKTVTALGSGKAGTTGTIQGRRAFIFLVTQSKLAHQIYGQVAKDQGEFTSALQAMEKTTGVRWGVFTNQLKALALAIGSDVVPALLNMVGPLESLIKWWGNLDESTRSFIARFATYTAAFLLVGGAVSFLAGTLVRLFAFFGKFIGVGASLSVTFGLIALAVAALSGNIRSLGDVLNVIAGFTFGSWTGFAVTLGIAASMALKLTGALRGVAAAEGTAAGGGILASLLGRGRGAARGFAMGREVGGLRTALMGAATGAGLLSGALLPVGAIIAAGIGGLYLWHRHMDQVRKDAEALKAAAAVGAGPRHEADVFQGIVGSVETIERARISIRGIQRTITDLRKQLKGAKGTDRQALLDQIELQTLDLADAQGTLTAAYAKSNRQFDAYTAAFAKFIPASKQVQQLRDRLKELQALRGTKTGVFQDIPGEIDKTRARLRALTSELRTSAVGMQKAFNGVVLGLARIGQIPRPSRAALQDMFNISKQAGRMLTIPEIKAVIRAEVDPRARRRIPADIRAIFARVQSQRIKVQVEQAAAKKAATSFARTLGTTPAKLRAILQPLGSQAAREHSKAAKILTPLHQKVIVDPPANLGKIGADIAAGVQAGVSANPVHGKVYYDAIVEPARKALQTHSPSRVMEKQVGVPIMQGIIVGILSQRGELEKTATIVADIFGGKVLSELDAKKKITPGLLTKDLQSQLTQYRKFNNALARLARRGAPKALIDQLAALGPEAADKIAMLSRMSAPELKRYIRLWQQAQKEIKRSMRTTQEDIKSAQKEFLKGLVDSVTGVFDQLLSQNQQNFGELFANIDPATYGEGFKQAMADYNQNVSDFQSQLNDLNNQLADLAKQKTDQLTQAFGPLFSGDWLSGEEVQRKIDWGQKLGFDDLFKDLQSQLNKFNNWKSNLTGLAKRVPPALARELAALGPEAADKIAILNNASDDQLKQYVALWNQSKDSIAQAAKSNVFDTQEILDRTAELITQIQQVTEKLAELKMPHELTGQDLIDSINKQIDQWNQYQGILDSLVSRGLPAEFVAQLAAMGPQALPLLQGIANMTDDQLGELTKNWEKGQSLITDATIKMLNRQLKLWFSYGANIAQEIINGVSSQGARLSDYFEQLITALLEHAKPPNPPAPPGSTAPDDTQKPSTGGVNTGSAVPYQHGTSSTYTNVNMTVNALQDESLASTLAKAKFRLENR